jgi:hypothetical protein
VLLKQLLLLTRLVTLRPILLLLRMAVPAGLLLAALCKLDVLQL